jgi:hypothetical protein
MVAPISPSSTCQAWGGQTTAPASARRSPAALNQATLAQAAPATNQPRKATGCCAPMLPTSSTVSR